MQSCDCQKPRRMLKGKKGSRNRAMGTVSLGEASDTLFADNSLKVTKLKVCLLSTVLGQLILKCHR